MGRRFVWALTWISLLLFAAICQTLPAAAQTVADFYKGKTVNILVGFAPAAAMTSTPGCSVAISAVTSRAIRMSW
jgi:hypothetical protein